MRHRNAGRHLGRTPSHRKAMLRNLAVSLILSSRPVEDDPRKPEVAGRVITTVEKAKEVKPLVEKLVTLARRAISFQKAAESFATTAPRQSDAWKEWRKSEQWQKWVKAISPAVALRRRAFARLRDKQAVEILFSDLGPRFEDRNGGYTRVVRLAEFRLGDAGRKALLEFVGKNDRVKTRKRQAPVVRDDAAAQTAEANA